jgi:glutaredoxin
MKNYLIGALVILIVLILISKATSYADVGGSGANGRSVVDKGEITVYGSKTCPWCVKQEDYLKQYGIPYTFVNCKDQQCPDFVKGFPTLVINGETKSGYTEV